jgi:5-methylcytosine-specific restriction endonuclease McrA
MRTYKRYSPAELVRWIREMESHNDYRHHAFYISKAWLHLRNEVLNEQHHECQLCKTKGLFVPAVTVHHIKTVRSRPDLALTKSNLLCVCADCHYKIHHSNISRWNDEKW